MYLMLLPGIIYFLIYRYGPMWFLLTAFMEFRPFLGFWQSEWVGLAQFERLFTGFSFWTVFQNTLILSLLQIIFNFPLPIIFALMINEVKFTPFKRTVQTITYMPNFLSWTIVAGMTIVLFTSDGGLINEAVYRLGFGRVNFLANESALRPMIVGQSMWRNTGWGTIIYLAAITGVDTELFEAARIDGANRMQQLWHITLPCIRPTIVILFILNLGNIMDANFEQMINMINPLNRSVGEVFDTYVWRVGINAGQFSYATAVGLFRSVVGLILVIAADRLAKFCGEEGLL